MEIVPIELLSREQKYAYDRFIRGDNLFITGPGGSGKTQLIHHLVNVCKQTNKEVAVCALTGCASIVLNVKATTVHSWAGIKLANGPPSKIINYVLSSKYALDNWKKVNVLIIDEISMMSVKILELLEKIGRKARRNPNVFGGIQVVFTGDFYQLPPVGDPNEPSTCQFCFQSTKWKEIFPFPYNSILLDTIFRQNDSVYKNILNEIRIGQLSEENSTLLQQRVNHPKPENEIITRLFPTKSRVDTINKYNYEKIEEKEYRHPYFVITNYTRYVDTSKPIPYDIIQECKSMTEEDIDFETKRILSNIQTTEIVCLKKGTIVMLTFNLSIADGLCNGSQGIIIDIVEEQYMTDIPEHTKVLNIPIVQFNNGLIQPIKPKLWQSYEKPCICIGQFPLIHAWALTIHKIQGASLDCGEVDAGSAIFEYGQTYVGLSRIRSLDGLYLTNFNPKRIKAHPLVKQFYKTIRNINELEEVDFTIAVAVAAPVNPNNELEEYIPEAIATIIK
jgi:ATP-dependent DNA helicase PIF1